MGPRRVLALLALLLVLPAAPAAAHTALLGADPAPGSRLAYSPEEVLLRFATPVDPATLDVALRSAEGEAVPLTPLVEGAQPISTAAFGVPRLPHGVYGLTWSSVGDDGHRASGEVLFGVGVPPGDTAVVGVAGDRVALGLDWAAGLARVAWYLALAGLAALALLGRGSGVVAVWLAGRRRGLLLAVAGAALARAALGVAIVARAGGGIAPSRSAVLWTAVAVGAVAAAVGGVAGRSAGGRVAGGRVGWGLLGGAVLLGTLAGHAPSREDPVLAVTFGAAHVGAAAVWVGPLLAVLAASRSAAWRDLRPADRTAQLRAATARIAPAAGWALAAVLASGAMLALPVLGDVLGDGFTAGPFTGVLLAKTAVVLAVVLPLGVLHHRRRDRATAVGRTWRVEAAALVAVVVLGSGLVAVDPGWGGPVGGADQALAALLDGQVADPAACADLDVGRAACTRSALATLLVDEGPQAAVDALAELQATDPAVAADCHQVAHDLGNDAAERLPDMADALAVEASLCWSGYYHGFVEARLAGIDDAALVADLPGFCDGAADPRYSFTHYNCVHGLGHGVMLRVDADLHEALPLCEQLDEEWTIRSCASGVFMEHVMAAQQGIEGLAFQDDDLLAPCTDLEGPLVEDCWLMQTSHILWRLQGDVAGAFSWCDRAPADHRDTCYRSMGRDISGRSLLDAEQVLAQCRLGAPDLVGWCLDGAAANAVYETADTVAADRLCAMVTGVEAQRCTRARDVAAGIVAAG